jgi:hypothetical protein
MATDKKVIRVGGGGSTPTQQSTEKIFVPTPESKGKATQLRIIACILWFLAICAQVFAISLLFKQPVNMTWIIILIVIDLALVIIGALLWKKSNRLDPASEKDKLKFFLQSQLGLVAAIVAFLPLVIFILTSKNLDGKQKGILGGIAAAALVIAGIVGTDFNPPSIEKYTEQSMYVQELMGADKVYGTKSGSKYHLYEDCQYLRSDRTTAIFEGTVADLYANNSRIKPDISSLCSVCEKRAAKEKGWTDEQLQQAKDKVFDVVKGIVE